MPNAHGARGCTGKPDGKSDLEVAEELDCEDVLGRVVLRLVNREHVDDGVLASCTYAREHAGGLLELLELLGPGPARYLRDGDVARYGRRDLWAAALENLLSAPLARHKVIEWPWGTRIHELWDESATHTASKVLVLKDVLRRVLGTDDFPYGVLVVLPTDAELAFLPIEVCQAFGALPALAAYAREAFESDAGRLTPEVFWWRGGELRTVVSDADEGLDEQFVAMMMRVAEDERDRESGVRP